MFVNELKLPNVQALSRGLWVFSAISAFNGAFNAEIAEIHKGPPRRITKQLLAGQLGYREVTT